MTRRISSSRPMTGSILPSRARWVRSWPYFSRAWNCSSGFWRVTRWLPRTSRSACSSSSLPTPEAVVHGQQQVLDREVVVLQVLAVARRRPRRRCWSRGSGGARRRRRPWAAWPTASSARLRSMSGARPSFCTHGRHDGVVLAQERAEQVVGRELGVAGALAASMAAATACWVLGVHLFGSSAMLSRLPPRVDPATTSYQVSFVNASRDRADERIAALALRRDGPRAGQVSS